MKNEVCVAMSGGVDSSVCALLAQKTGFRVIGVHLKMFREKPADRQLYECCEKLGIELVERDCCDAFFERVIRPCALEYERGRTPNPCCECNESLKFRELFAAADALGVEKVFTGHYVRMSSDPDGTPFLLKGCDRGKDQSYFLYRLSSQALRRVGFPLGAMQKNEVRAIAAEAGLPCAERPESQDACFQVPGECCGETLHRAAGLPERHGFFLHQGKLVGRHFGIHRYTIGQRQGLGVALGVPAYVARINAEKREIHLTTDGDKLLCDHFQLSRLNWQCAVPPSPGEVLEVRVRYRSPAVPCTLDGENRVCLQTPVRAVTPGQAAVFYRGERLLGGGVISAVAKPPTTGGCGR